MSKRKLGEILIEEKKIDADQLQAALGFQRQWGKRLGECLIQLGFIQEMELAKTLSKVLRIPVIDLAQIESSRITRDVLSFVTLQLARSQRIVPLGMREIRGKKRLIVASSDPLNYKIIDELQFRSGLPVLMMVTPDSDIEWFIRKYYLGEDDALSVNYISGRTPLPSKTPEGTSEIEIDPISNIFFDEGFTASIRIGKKKKD